MSSEVELVRLGRARALRRVRRAALSVAAVVIGSTALRAGLSLLGYATSYLLALTVVAAIVGLPQAIRLVRPARWVGRLALSASSPPRLLRRSELAPHTFDGMLDGIRSWSRRLEWRIDSSDDFDRLVGVRLRELVWLRLRHHGGLQLGLDHGLGFDHGLWLDADPDRLRALVGERGFRLLTEPVWRSTSDGRWYVGSGPAYRVEVALDDLLEHLDRLDARMKTH